MSESPRAYVLSMVDAGLPSDTISFLLGVPVPTRERILSLLDSGVSLKTISLLLDVPVSTVREVGENCA